MKYLIILLFLTVSLASNAQTSFTKTDFNHLTTATMFGMKYNIDSLIYEHGFKAIKSEEITNPYFFAYEHSYIEGVVLVVSYIKDSNFLSILLYTSDYNYYRGMRDMLTKNWEVVKSDVDFYGYNSKVLLAPIGKYVDGIKAEENEFLIGWATTVEDWDAMYEQAN
jgi:hypothetical protein